MKLSLERIEALTDRPGVDEGAVGGFLCTMTGLTQLEALACLELDCKILGLNTQTGRAIQQGIMEAIPDPEEPA